ncbi:hypothetical protein [Frankia sp. R82]|uniref:hypothetical protein n=1 Tax=Frankia sp. R82 TaxID=2950553 RepID=UPI002043BE16|nr:hypothetical protein [Frankia sp. R82]MCM3887028.1 hypothetical protein [Frankia sp. R82]
MTGVGTSSQPATGARPGTGSTADVRSGPRAMARWWASPPGRLRLISMVLTGLLVALWITAFVATRARQGALDALSGRPDGGHAATLTTALRLRSDLAAADAAATRARLGGNGGDEVARAQEAYRRAMTDAGGQLVALARAAADQTPALTVIVTQLPRYGAEVERAQAERSELMWGTLVPATDRIVAAEQAGVERELRRADGTGPLLGIVVIGTMAFGALVATQVWLVGRTNRILSPALAAAALLSAVAVGWALVAFGAQRDHLADAREHGYRPLTAASQARVLALRGRTDDIRALLDRPDAPRLDADSAAASTRLHHDPDATSATSDSGGLLATIGAPAGPDQAARAALTPAWSAYQDVATRIREDVDRPDGLWPAALLAQRDATVAFRAFDDRSVAVVGTSRAHLADDLSAAADALGLAPAAVSIALGLAVILTLVGLQLRINDYR